MNAYFINQAVFPSLQALLPEFYDTPEARAMLLAIALQESGLRHRRQIGSYTGKTPVYGPARSWWMFERIGVQGVLDHRASYSSARDVARMLEYPVDAAVLHFAMENNDILACAVARLLLRAHPDNLPGRMEMEKGWEQYLALWRPGIPREDSWASCWDSAWEVVGYGRG